VCARGALEENISAFAGSQLRRDRRKWQVRTRVPTTEHIVEGSAARGPSGARQMQVTHRPSASLLAASAEPRLDHIEITAETMPDQLELQSSESLLALLAKGRNPLMDRTSRDLTRRLAACRHSQSGSRKSGYMNQSRLGSGRVSMSV